MSKPAERMLHPPGEVYKYADATGGQVIEFKQKELQQKLAMMIDDLRMRYSLGYHPSAQKPKGKYCAIKVKLAPETKKTARQCAGGGAARILPVDRIIGGSP